MSEKKQVVQRHLLGVVSLTLFVLAAVLHSSGSAHSTMLSSACLRVGCVAAALWLAFPQVVPLVAKRHAWFIAATIICLIMVILRPRTAIALVPAWLALVALEFMGLLSSPSSTTRRDR